jgi:hypothetical protein
MGCVVVVAMAGAIGCSGSQITQPDSSSAADFDGGSDLDSRSAADFDGGSDSSTSGPDLSTAVMCDPLTNQGCPPSLKCTGLRQGDAFVLGCGTKGTKRQGDACMGTTAGDDCADHYVCIQLAGDAQPICRQFCVSDFSCPAVGSDPSACVLTVSPLPKPCEELKSCNPLDQTTCPIQDDCVVTGASGGQCWPAGTVGANEICQAVGDCARGFVCAGNDTGGYRCRQICNTIGASPACSDGYCNPLSDAPNGVGICQPHCNPLDQTPCSTEEACVISNLGDFCFFPGTVASGGACAYADDCARGFTCFDNGDGFKCRQICNTGTPVCTDGACTPLSGEPVGVGVCAPILPESDCFDGIDNNGDGLADCQDPTCTAKATCVPVAPSTETGIIQPGPCAGDYGTTEILHQGLSTDSCTDVCGCSVDVTCQCSGTLYYGGGANTCGGSTVDIGPTQDSFHPNPSASPCTDVTERAYEAAVFTTDPTPVSTKLTPSGSATMNTPTWSTTTNFCSTAKVSMTCGDAQHQCVPNPPSGGVCVKVPNQTDTAQCPVGYRGTTTTYFAGFTKGSCQCGNPVSTNTPACGGNEYLTFSTAGCQGVVGYSECSGACCSDLIYNVPPGNPPFKMDTQIIAAVENYWCMGSGTCSSSAVVATATTTNGGSIVCCQ